MILGIGIDKIKIPRIQQTLVRHFDKFKTRVFTPIEIAYCQARPHFEIARFAKRFAAKEACLKASGIGYRKGISWQDMEVDHNHFGQPHLTIRGTLCQLLEQRYGKVSFKAHLSMTDTDEDATAIVVLEQVTGAQHDYSKGKEL